eukprot:CAMPEP_0119315078 /NCGR_PEP_ID=MMETSP1333-20130426/34381_1 /TAXON_ID=418940 /ORGANISM="Scyphosphaera apsteinii, Strain RCC1455" /LENGTH=302 /DNA_ID=CAMNT_0007320309 /DNA_START=16 /DNA_END=924 /DNA_ORIENTATION=-
MLKYLRIFLGLGAARGDVSPPYQPPSSPPSQTPTLTQPPSVCLLTGHVLPEEAFAHCFIEHPTTTWSPATLVRMTDLVAGDTVLSDTLTSAQVIINQHRHSQQAQTVLIKLIHSLGQLTVTPEQGVVCDGHFVVAREVKPGSKLAGLEVGAITTSAGPIINVVTTTGMILAVSSTGGVPIVTTSGEGLSEVMLSGYSSFSITVLLALAFPHTAQMFYDQLCEPFFSMHLPSLMRLKSRVSPTSAAFGVLISDFVLTGAFTVYCAVKLKLQLAIATGFMFAAKHVYSFVLDCFFVLDCDLAFT